MNDDERVKAVCRQLAAAEHHPSGLRLQGGEPEMPLGIARNDELHDAAAQVAHAVEQYDGCRVVLHGVSLRFDRAFGFVQLELGLRLRVALPDQLQTLAFRGSQRLRLLLSLQPGRPPSAAPPSVDMMIGAANRLGPLPIIAFRM